MERGVKGYEEELRLEEIVVSNRENNREVGRGPSQLSGLWL